VSETLGSLTLTTVMNDQDKETLLQIIQTEICKDVQQECHVEWVEESASVSSTRRRLQNEYRFDYVVSVIVGEDESFADVFNVLKNNISIENVNSQLGVLEENNNRVQLNLDSEPVLKMIVSTTVDEDDTTIMSTTREDYLKEAVALAANVDKALLTTTTTTSQTFEPTVMSLGIRFIDVEYDETIHQTDEFQSALESVLKNTIAFEMASTVTSNFLTVSITGIRDGSVIVDYVVSVDLSIDLSDFESLFNSVKFQEDLLKAIEKDPFLKGKLVEQKKTFWDTNMILYVAVPSGVILILILITCSSVMGRKNRRSHSRLQKTQATQGVGDSYTLLDVIEEGEELTPLVIPFDKQHHM